MALKPYPVYNTFQTGETALGKFMAPRFWPGGLKYNRLSARHTRKMSISIPTTYASDGLRPVDLARDLPQVVELLKMVFGEALEGDEHQIFGEGIPGPLNDLLYRFNPVAARLSNGFVWQADGRIVGNATLLSTKSWDRYLVANVAVHPAYRRRGIARNLMEAITSSVKSRGGRVILLQVVKDNQPAIDLYYGLGYTSIGHMATWYATKSIIRQISPDSDGFARPTIELLSNRRWRDAYELDTSHVHYDLNWPEPLQPDAYRRTIWQRAADFMNGRQCETWTTSDSQGNLTGLARLISEWGRSHVISLRIRPDWPEPLERPLLAKVLRRTQYLPRRNVRIDHPETDEFASRLFQEANFSIQRILTHMRLDLSQ